MPGDSHTVPRPWIGVLFECCGVYARIYRAAAVLEYRGCCPRCGRALRMAVAAGGADAKSFRAR